MSLRQLLPVMDVIGHANKHLAKVTKFLRKYGDMDLFPVKFQVSRLIENMHAHSYVSIRDLSGNCLHCMLQECCRQGCIVRQFAAIDASNDVLLSMP